MFQHIKISKNLLKELTPKEFMVYGMIAAYLSIPDFQPPKGGFKPFVRKHTADGIDGFNNAWYGLQRKGYLKILRVPIGSAKFEYRFELRSKPDPVTPTILTMTCKDGRKYLKKGKNLYTEPSSRYLIVSRETLLDSKLSLNAKWLWTVIHDQMDLLEKKLLDLPYIRKSDLFRATGFSAGVFEKAWAMLKNAGYLHVARFFDRYNGVTRCEYTLTATANVDEPMPKTQIDDRRRKDRAEVLPPVQTRSIADEITYIPDFELDRAAAETVIKQNIQYDQLRRFAQIRQPDGFSYSVEQLDGVVARMVRAICNSAPTTFVNGVETSTTCVRERMLSLDCNHIQAALRGIWSAGNVIQNPSAYLLTVLYNSVEAI